MKIKLRKDNVPGFSSIETFLYNRGIAKEDMLSYLETTDDIISDPYDFGDVINDAAKMLILGIRDNKKALIICDCDCDGFTSAALLCNFLYDIFPTWTINNLKWYVHEGKEHGLNDVMSYINSKNFDLIIVPDAGSNDYECHKELKENGKDILILDHHLADKISEYACVVNNQLSDYKNKELSGVGIVWQFCRYIDRLLQSKYAEEYLDLVAIGNTGDMMSMLSKETKHLINKGLGPENIHNPYIYEMWQKNKFKLGEHMTSIDAAFYIVPMINAVQRSGTIEEKEILFKSMLKYEAFNMILSDKRGHAVGEEERLVDKAIRMSTNVKNRQTKAQDEGMKLLEKKIIDENWLDHKAIILTLENGVLDKNIAGLVANKIAAKYQRPCCVLTKTMENDPGHITFLPSGDEVFVTGAARVLYQGSARGYEATGITDFKKICEKCGAEWAQGHGNAFGVCVEETNLNSFISNIDNELEDITNEIVYWVDYIYTGTDVPMEDIFDLATLKPLFGKDMPETLIAIKDLKITKGMVNVYRKSSNTLKISLPSKVSLMLFNATDELCDKLENMTSAYISADFVGKPAINEYMGNYSAQIMIEDFEITGEGKYLF